MQIEEKIDEKYITVSFLSHRAVIATRSFRHDGEPNSTQASQNKLKIIDELCNKEEIFMGKQKELLKQWSKGDEFIAKVYALAYPRGGYHGGGRKKGSFSNKPKTNKTERLNIAVTPEEKQAIIKFLNNMRGKDEK